MATIVREKYTITDARNRREPREYAGVIIRVAKSAELGSASHIIMLIYNGLDLEFQRDLAMPLLSTSLEQFLQDLDNHKDIWWGLAGKSARPYNMGPFHDRFGRNPYYSNVSYNRDQSRFNNYANLCTGREGPYQPLSKDSNY